VVVTIAALRWKIAVAKSGMVIKIVEDVRSEDKCFKGLDRIGAYVSRVRIFPEEISL